MFSADPVKSVGICFFQTGLQTEYFLKCDDHRSIDTLPDFLREIEAVIVSLENFSAEETQHLRKTDAMCDGSIFAPSDCFGRDGLRRGSECARLCPLKLRRNR